MSADKRAILRRVRVFADLGDDDCDALLRVLKARRGAPGDTLFAEGDRGDCLMIVLEGRLVARVGTEEVATLGPGEVVGEMAFVDAEPRSATVSTPGGATVLEFSREALASLRRAAPRVAASIQRNLLLDVARRLREVGEKGVSPPQPSGAAAGPPSHRRPGRGPTVVELRAIPALAAYPVEDLELLAYIGALRGFSAASTLMQEGAEGDACWLVLAGSVAVTRGGQSTALATLGPGAIVGQLALLDRAPRAATVTARTDTTTLEVPAAAFGNLLRAHSPIALRFQDQIARAGVRQLREATKRYAESSGRFSLVSPPASIRTIGGIDDWDDGSEDLGPPLELAIEPASRRR